MHDERLLSGKTIGITAQRKAEEFGGQLERRGARVIYGPSMRTVDLPEDGQLAEATERVLDAPVHYVVAITGVGFRGWMRAAEIRGVHDQLAEHLRTSTLLARGAKARGAIRGAGFADPWTAPSEESAEVLEHLLRAGVSGKRVVVQLHGEPMRQFRGRLTEAGAEVIAVPVYRWTDPLDLGPLDALIHATVRGEIDALPFTSAPCAANLLDRADRIGQGEALRERLRRRVLLACVGPVTAAPIAEAGLPYVLSERARSASLIRLLEDRLSAR